VAERTPPGPDAAEPVELRRLRRRIDALDRRIVRLLNDRAELARQAGRIKATTGRRAIRDPQREREILLRVSMANDGPTPQADLLAIYKRLFAVARSLERRDRTRERRATPFGGVPPSSDES
jgi:chorismate mutase/prephenate dehydratase